MSSAPLADPAHERLTRLWQAHRPAGPVLPWELKTAYASRWVRFHSLPGSKRYAEDETEYAILLDRYNTVLDELFAGGEVYVVTIDWADPSEPTHWSAHRAALHPEGTLWTTLDETDHPDPDDHIRWFYYADRRPWRRGCVDPLFRAAADEALPGVFVTDTGLTRIHAPYDGGADVVLATPEERDRLRDRHTAWLSAHPSGY
ncbi:DUF3885 domain-containing protein [Streptomyces sp. CB02009]|uniref:DUF3885 domain-containing protein n=1 Tax=Streptomyces sp. CB02009 TaxID=1703938 RepID=UPI000A51D00C|nr:hypothetical protein [Streptomyces sp. CB02009]